MTHLLQSAALDKPKALCLAHLLAKKSATMYLEMGRLEPEDKLAGGGRFASFELRDTRSGS